MQNKLKHGMLAYLILMMISLLTIGLSKAQNQSPNWVLFSSTSSGSGLTAIRFNPNPAEVGFQITLLRLNVKEVSSAIRQIVVR